MLQHELDVCISLQLGVGVCRRTDRQTRVIPGPLLCVCACMHSCVCTGANPDAACLPPTPWEPALCSPGPEAPGAPGSGGEEVCPQRQHHRGQASVRNTWSPRQPRCWGHRAGQRDSTPASRGCAATVGARGQARDAGGCPFLLWPPHVSSLRAPHFLLSPTSRPRVGIRPEAGGPRRPHRHTVCSAVHRVPHEHVCVGWFSARSKLSLHLWHCVQTEPMVLRSPASNPVPHACPRPSEPRRTGSDGRTSARRGFHTFSGT